MWKDLGSPQSPTEDQYEQLQRAGQLQLLTSPAWMPINQGAAHLELPCPGKAFPYPYFVGIKCWLSKSALTSLL